MSRILLFLAMLAVAVAIAVFLLSIWRGIWLAGQDMARPIARAGFGGRMAPNGVQKIAYVALIVVMFGVATGWLGGL